MASAFSICALVVHWRVYIPPGAAEQNGDPIPDPKWCVCSVFNPEAAVKREVLTKRSFLQVNRHQRSSISYSSHIESLLADEYGSKSAVLHRSANHHHRMVRPLPLIMRVSDRPGIFLRLL